MPVIVYLCKYLCKFVGLTKYTEVHTASVQSDWRALKAILGIVKLF